MMEWACLARERDAPLGAPFSGGRDAQVLRQRDAPPGAPLVQEGVRHKCSARRAEGPCM